MVKLKGFLCQEKSLCFKPTQPMPQFYPKIPKRETLGPFDWVLMGFIGVPLFKGQVMRNDENKKMIKRIVR